MATHFILHGKLIKVAEEQDYILNEVATKQRCHFYTHLYNTDILYYLSKCEQIHKDVG